MDSVMGLISFIILVIFGFSIISVVHIIHYDSELGTLTCESRFERFLRHRREQNT
jgi:hypothetical protein